MILATGSLYMTCSCCVFTRERIIKFFTPMTSSALVHADEADDDAQTMEQPRCSTVPHPFSNRREYAIRQ